MHRPSMAQRFAFRGASVLLLGAFVLYLLVSISTPVTQRFTFLDYTMRSGNTSVALKVGLWGSCRQNLTPFAGPLVCQRATVPYLIDMRDFPGRVNQAMPFVVGKLSIPLVLYPISAALAFFGLIAAIMGNSHLLVLNAQGATLFGQAAMIIMFILYLRTDQQIREAHRGLTGGLGNAIWMGLVASLISGIALLFGLMSTAEETRKHGSLIKKEVYV